MPGSITSIQYEAFRSCDNLTKVSLLSGVETVEVIAFGYCNNLKSIFISDTVSQFGTFTLDMPSKLEEINVDEKNPYYSSIDGILFNKGQTEILNYPRGKADTEYTIPESVVEIGEYAFVFSSLASIDLPDSLTNIGEEAFAYCSNLASIDLPDSLTDIGENAFYECSSLTSVDLP